MSSCDRVSNIMVKDIKALTVQENKDLKKGVICPYIKIVGNGATWDRFEHKTKFKKVKFKKKLNFVF